MKAPDRAAPSLEILEGRSLPASLAPVSLADGAAPGTLRTAIVAANADASADDFTISLKAGTYRLTVRNAAGPENAAASGDLDVTTTAHKVVIAGRGKATVIDASALRDRIFHLLGPGVRLELRDLVLRGGLALDDGTDVGTDAHGGAGLNAGGTLTLTNVVLTGNRAMAAPGAAARGGAIYSSGGAVVLAGTSAVNNNQALGGGGGVDTPDGGAAEGGGLCAAGGTLTLTGAALSGNVARGGAGYNGRNSVLSTSLGPPIVEGADGGNGASGLGGGLFASGGAVTLTLTTFSANVAQGGRGGNGAPAGGVGGAAGSGDGGGVFSSDRLSVSDSAFTGNVARGGGGGLSYRGGSSAPGGVGGNGTGGGISADAADLHSSTFSVNQAVGGAGGSGGVSTADDASGGTGGDGGSGQGGGVYAAGGTLANLTFAGNSAIGAAGGAGAAGRRVPGFSSSPPTTGSGGDGGAGGSGLGGGLYAADGTVTLLGSTLSGNVARKAAGGAAGGGPLRGERGTAGTAVGGVAADGVTVRNTISAGNTGADGPDFGGSAAAASGNLLGNGTGATGFGGNGNQVGTAAAPINPRLSRLGFNGGPTATFAPLAGSPALDAGDVSASPGATDQRGAARVTGPIDIGAVEIQSDVRLTASASPASAKAGGTIAITLTVTNLGPDAATLVSLTSEVPQGTAFLSLVVPPGWKKTTPVANGAGVITATLPALARGGRSTVRLVLRVGTGAMQGDVIPFSAALAAARDPAPGNNAVSLDIPVT